MFFAASSPTLVRRRRIQVGSTHAKARHMF